MGELRRTKKFYKSKINWIGVFLVLFTLFSSQDNLSGLISISQHTKDIIISISGFLLIVCRTFLTNKDLIIKKDNSNEDE
jgi:hypothetical protein